MVKTCPAGDPMVPLLRGAIEEHRLGRAGDMLQRLFVESDPHVPWQRCDDVATVQCLLGSGESG